MAFAFASCQDWASGYYSALRHLAEEDLDLVLHLGDYVYDGGIPADGGVPQDPGPRGAPTSAAGPGSLADAIRPYRTDRDLQGAHARFPRQFDVVDGRQYRSVPPCGWGEADACAAAYGPSVTMLGATQERWLYDGLRRPQAPWDMLGSNVMLARLDHDGAAGPRLWHDAWDGFPAARNRLTRAWQRAETRTPVVITGDWHSTFVNDIKADFDRPDSPRGRRRVRRHAPGL